jgi:hypothetical protein
MRANGEPPVERSSGDAPATNGKQHPPSGSSSRSEAAPTPAQLDAAYRDLIKADVVAFAGVGLRGHLLEPTLAYRTVRRAIAIGQGGAAAVKPKLEHIMRAGTPAGKVYAAVLMREVDPAAARTFWKSVSGESTPISTFIGCVRGRTTVAQFAEDQLSVGD